MLQKRHHPLVVDVVEERLDVGIQYPVHLALLQCHRQGVERVVLAAPRAESIRESEKVLFIYRA
ncbi:hypothetical protein D9M69_648100 [compost metagenome]